MKKMLCCIKGKTAMACPEKMHWPTTNKKEKSSSQQGTPHSSRKI